MYFSCKQSISSFEGFSTLSTSIGFPTEIKIKESMVHHNKSVLCECLTYVTETVSLHPSASLHIKKVSSTEFLFKNFFKANSPMSSNVSALSYNKLDLKNKAIPTP